MFQLGAVVEGTGETTTGTFPDMAIETLNIHRDNGMNAHNT